MKKLLIEAVCNSPKWGGKLKKRIDTLQRFTTLIMLLLCSVGTALAQEEFTFYQQSKTAFTHISDDKVITAAFTETGLSYQVNYVKFTKGGTGNLTITADAGSITNVTLFVSKNKDENVSNMTGIDVKPNATSIDISDATMPVAWTGDSKVVFSCADESNKNLYVFGATITYKGVDDGKLSLNAVTLPTITPGKNTTTSKLSFTITQTAEAQEGTTLTTWYTTDGSNPNDAGNVKRVKLNGTSETLTLDWAKDDKITVRAFTTRVQDDNTSNYVDGDEATQEFSNTGSTDLASVDAPVITPGDQTVVASSLDVTIADAQWTATLADKLKVYYVTYESGEDRAIADDEWKAAKSLPLTLPLSKTSTVKAYAEYTSDETTTKTAVVSRTYFLLDEKTTYMVPSGTKNMTVGATAEKNGMTMTFGGIQVGSNKFKNLSKNDKTDDNVLGKVHTISGTPLFLNEDVESELGNGSRAGEYQHYLTDTKLHENTFALPAKGSFFKFEPEANGKLTVFVEQQGAIHNVSGTLHPDVVRKRPVYFLDEAGNTIKATFAYTSSKVNSSDWNKIKSTATKSGDEMYSKEYMETLEDYYQNIIDGNNTTFTNANSAVADKYKKLTLGTSIQPIIVLHEKCNADILKNDGVAPGDGDVDYDGTGYMLISEGYVTYQFPVQAGKTYYLFAYRTKLSLAGFTFEKDENYSTTPVDIDGNADNAEKINSLEVDKQYDVTLKNRKFSANKWYTLVLPFSVSQKQMKQIFGNDVVTVHYNGVEGTNLNLFEHFYKMVVGGTPLLVKPSQDVTGDITFNNVTLTSNEVVDIESNGYKCTGSWNNEDFPEYSYFIDAKDNTFYQYDPTKLNGGVAPHAGAFRTWIVAAGDASKAQRLTMNISGISDAGETTGIWNAINGTEETVAAEGIYNLNGQKVAGKSADSLPKGIYIVDGKKYIVK